MERDAIQALIDADRQHHLHPMTPPHDTVRLGARMFVRGEGMHLIDAEGTRFMDAYSGMGNVILGHAHPAVTQAIKDQLDELAYVPNFFRYGNPAAARLAALLTGLAPASINHVHFANSGSEANELSFKLARLYHKIRGHPAKTGFISRDLAYHGVTAAALAAGGVPQYRQYFEPMVEGFSHIVCPNRYRCTLCAGADACTLACADELEVEILRRGPESIAGFIVEPVVGVGGHIIPPAGYYQRIREICDRHDVLLLVDEVVTGFGRTGTFFGMEHWGVVPDLMSVAKGITSGYLPLGATLIGDGVWQAIYDAGPDYVFSHGHTTSGHPVCCAAGVATIETIQRDNLVENSRVLGDYLLTSLRQGLGDNPFAGDIRGLGLLASVELVRDPVTKEKFSPGEKVGARVYQHIMELGVIVRTANDIISIRPPLIATRQDIDTIVAAVVEAVDELERTAVSA